MKQLIEKLRPLVSGSATAVSHLRKRLTEARPNAVEARLEALEKTMEIQATLNETVDVQVKLIHALLEQAQKRLQIVTFVLIASATVAALAFAAALMR
jgi:hypothetical protein